MSEQLCLQQFFLDDPNVNYRFSRPCQLFGLTFTDSCQSGPWVHSLCALLEPLALERVALVAAIGNDPQERDGNAAQEFWILKGIMFVGGDSAQKSYLRIG